MTEIIFDFEGMNAYDLALGRLIAMLSDLRPFWPRLVPLFIGWMRERFATEGKFGGDTWAELSPDYLARKQLVYPGKGILYATGDLRKAASKPRRVVTPRTITFIVDDSEYRHGGREARSVIDYHQQGTDNMPARPVIPESWNELLPPMMRAEVETAAQEWIDEMAVRLGLR